MIRILITGCSMHSNDLINELRNNYDNEEIYIVGINCEDVLTPDISFPESMTHHM